MTIHDIDVLKDTEKRKLLSQCCASTAWVEKMIGVFPVEDLVELLNAAEEKWYECNENDWKEAFSSHPKIGDTNFSEKNFNSNKWTSDEQGGLRSAEQSVITAFAYKNGEYEKKYGYIFIVSASGKSAEDMLSILEKRLNNNPEDEIKIAADEQNKIIQLRLQKLLV